jgi:hypothetical protein
MLEERVTGVRFPGCLGKTCCILRRVPVVIFMCILFALMIGCASTPIAGKDQEPIFGTWANNEYMSGYWVWRFIYQPNGQVLTWSNGKLADQPNNYEGRFTIDKKWVDSEGNTWYRSAEKVCIAPYSEGKAIKEYGLIKVRVAGSVLEGEWSTVDFPKEFGALGNQHFLFYRQ